MKPFIPDRWKYIIAHDRGGNFNGTGQRAYHAEVGPRGQVWMRDPNKTAPHAYKANPEAFGVSATGQVGQMPGQQQLSQLKNLFETSQAQDRERFGRGREWVGHGHAYQKTAGMPNQASKLGRSTSEARWLDAVKSNGSGTPGNPAQPWHNASGMEGMVDGSDLADANWMGNSGASEPQPAPQSLMAQRSAGPAGGTIASGPAQQGQDMAERKPPSLFGALANNFQSPAFMGGAVMFDSAARGGGIADGARMVQQGRQREQEIEMRRAQAAQQEAIRQQDLQRRQPLDEAKLRLLQAQAAKMQGTNSTQWGKTGPVFEMNGQTYTVQFADDGSRKVLPLDPGMVPASHSPTLAVKKQEALGDAKSRAEAASKLPTMELKAKQLIGYMDAVVNHPGYGVGTSIVGSRLPSYSETAQDFDERVGQIQGQTFMLAFQDLKGAGPITDLEGAKATAAYGRVANTKVGSENYKRAVADLKKEVLALVDVVRKKASGGAPQSSAAPENDPLGIR